MIGLRLGACALVSCALAGGLAACGGGGGGDRKAPPTAPATAPGAHPQGSTATTTAAAPNHPRARAKTVAIAIPRGWHRSAKVGTKRSWPLPLRVFASFPIPPGSTNAACPKTVLAAMPPHGVYVLVAEYTKPRPPGIPASAPVRPRGDLRHLDLRPAEVECWDGGLSGAARFTDRGRAFYVEVLLGARAGARERRRALDALASLTVGPS